MKKLVMLLVAFATLQVSAQDQKKELKKQRPTSRMTYSPEEMAQLQSKKLTLKLDLDRKQQEDVSVLFLEQAKLRQSKNEAYLKSEEKAEVKTWSKEERFKMANARLDRQIETKRKLKTILSSDQYEKYAKMTERQSPRGKRYHTAYRPKKYGRSQHQTKP